MNTFSERYPYKNKFIDVDNFNEKDKIYTFAIGSNNNNADWTDFLDANINNAIIDPKSLEKVTQKNINSFRNCLRYVSEGILKNYYLTFSSYSFKRQGLGVACIRKCKNSSLRGGIFELVSDNNITKKQIIELIRWKEDFPYLYQEQLLPVKSPNGKQYRCLTYNIVEQVNVNSLNKMMPTILLPSSSEYFQVIYDAHKKHNFDNKWLNSLENIGKVTDIHKRQFQSDFNDVYNNFKSNSTNFPLINYIKTHFKNKNYRPLTIVKNNEYETFKIYTLLALQLMKQFVENNISNKEIVNIINNTNKNELKLLIKMVENLANWDEKLQFYQKN